MTAKVFIDGEAGTTGLQIKSRLEGRSDLTLLHLKDDERKDTDRRREMLNEADLAVLCLPDAAARESVSLIDNPETRVIDASTAHRTAPDWVYGFPEYEAGHSEKIAQAKRLANPGCYALSSVAVVHPLITAGLVPADWPVTINAVSGYSGGGKSLIAEFEDSQSGTGTDAPFFTYGHTLSHKHIPEIIRWSGLDHAPVFVPSVGRFSQGMIVQVPLPLWSIPGGRTPGDIHGALTDHYSKTQYVSVVPLEETREMIRLTPEILNGTNELRLHVFGNEADGQAVVMALLDNLGKGASGQAVQNLNIMLGLEESAGL
ncbi:MAG: N-acetyl-gamma-glutamyl-phosphate reductase [Hyphomicrobiaceae bacterium]|nr:N-acetyl-gamma-glutamyl-phosphate reductase [Hyphomicrobiaceae bacterium]